MFRKITTEDLKNKGVTGMPETPDLSVTELQKKFDEIGKEVITPIFNETIELLNSNAASESLGAKPTSNMTGVSNNIQSILQGLDDMVHNLYLGAKFSIDNTSGHLIATFIDGTTQDIGQITFSPKGKWNVNSVYKSMDMVYFNGCSYIAIKNVPVGTEPIDTEYWILSADPNEEVNMLNKYKADKSYVDATINMITTDITNMFEVNEKTLVIDFANSKMVEGGNSDNVGYETIYDGGGAE